MKTLISIRREIWGKVKFYATVKGMPLNAAVESLLNSALMQIDTQTSNSKVS